MCGTRGCSESCQLDLACAGAPVALHLPPDDSHSATFDLPFRLVDVRYALGNVSKGESRCRLLSRDQSSEPPATRQRVTRISVRETRLCPSQRAIAAPPRAETKHHYPHFDSSGILHHSFLSDSFLSATHIEPPQKVYSANRHSPFPSNV